MELHQAAIDIYTVGIIAALGLAGWFLRKRNGTTDQDSPTLSQRSRSKLLAKVNQTAQHWPAIATSLSMEPILVKAPDQYGGIKGIYKGRSIECRIWKQRSTCVVIDICDTPVDAAWIAICAPEIWEEPMLPNGYIAHCEAIGLEISLSQRKDAEGAWATGSKRHTKERYEQHKDKYFETLFLYDERYDDISIFATPSKLYVEVPDNITERAELEAYIGSAIDLLDTLLQQREHICTYLQAQCNETKHVEEYTRFLAMLARIDKAHETIWEHISAPPVHFQMRQYYPTPMLPEHRGPIERLRIILLHRHFPEREKTKEILARLRHHKDWNLALLAMLLHGWEENQDAIAQGFMERLTELDSDHWEAMGRAIDEASDNHAQLAQQATMLLAWRDAQEANRYAIFPLTQVAERFADICERLPHDHTHFQQTQKALLELLKFTCDDQKTEQMFKWLGVGPLPQLSPQSVHEAAIEALGRAGGYGAIGPLERYARQWMGSVHESRAAKLAIDQIKARIPAAEGGMLSLHVEEPLEGAVSYATHLKEDEGHVSITTEDDAN